MGEKLENTMENTMTGNWMMTGLMTGGTPVSGKCMNSAMAVMYSTAPRWPGHGLDGDEISNGFMTANDGRMVR